MTGSPLGTRDVVTPRGLRCKKHDREVSLGSDLSKLTHGDDGSVCR